MLQTVGRDAITLKNVTHYFKSGDKRVHLFNNLSLSIEKGKSTAISGPSGSGKTSLLTLAAGLETPISGEIKSHRDGELLSTDEMRQNNGFIFQQFHLLPELDAINNLALPLRLRGNKQAHEKAAQWLERVGLADRGNHKPSQLSGGEQQRVAIARAFITEPSFIFADEPTGNLDEATSELITDLMFDCAEDTGCGLVLVTHNRKLAARADRCLRLSSGTLEQVS